MRYSQDGTAHIGVNTILQAGPEAQDAIAKKLVVVVLKETWGCMVRGPEGGEWRVAWTHLEDTGGRLVFDANGQRLTPDAAPIKHHP